MDNLYTESNKKFHEIRGQENNSLKPLIIKNISNGHFFFI